MVVSFSVVGDRNLQRYDNAPSINRSTPALGAETPAVTGASSSGEFEIVLFDTPFFQPGTIVTVSIEIWEGCDPYVFDPTPPRWDLDPIWYRYDPFMEVRGYPFEHHISAWQPAFPPLPVTTPYDVPYILVVPVTGWTPPPQGIVITNFYPFFDDYYATGTPEDWYGPE